MNSHAPDQKCTVTPEILCGFRICKVLLTGALENFLPHCPMVEKHEPYGWEVWGCGLKQSSTNLKSL